MQAAVVAAMVRKDLLLFLADKRSVIMSFAAPIAIATFFGFIFAPRKDVAAARVPVLVVDEDGSEISKAIAASMAKDAALDVRPAAAAAAREAVRKGSATVAVVLPKDFGDRAGSAFFGAGDRPTIGLWHDPSHGPELAMVRGVLAQHVMESVSSAMFSGAAGARLTDDALAKLAQDRTLPEAERAPLADLLQSVHRWQARPQPAAGSTVVGGFSTPYDVKEQPVTAGEGAAFNSYAHYFGGMGVQFLLFACIDLATRLLRERQQGLWKRLRAAPVSRATVLLSKGASGTLVSLATLLVTFAFGMLVFRIRIEGSAVGFLAVCVATSAMASSFGLLIAALGRTPEATRGVAIVAVLLMVMLGGAWVPSFVFPAFVQQVSLAVPARWAVDGLDATTWRGIDLAGVLPTIGVLFGFAALFGAIAVARFRWQED